MTEPFVYIDRSNNTICIEFKTEPHFCEVLPNGFNYMCDKNHNILGIYTKYISSEQSTLVCQLTSLYRTIKEREEYFL